MLFLISKTAISNEIRHHTIVSGDKSEAGIIKTMHEHLDVVDEKTASLLTFNALMIAIISLSFSSDELKAVLKLYPFAHWIVWVSAALIATATFLCLNSLDIIGSHSKRDRDGGDYIAHAAAVCVSRTNYFRASRLLTRLGSLIALGILLIGLAKG
jgi:hypothetical protein